MRTMSKLIPGVLVLLVGVIFIPFHAQAEPCLMLYPQSFCTYHYDPHKHHTVGVGDPLYDPAFDRGGEVLIKTNKNEIDLVPYQAPNLTGFVADHGQEGWFFIGSTFDLIVDGWSPRPTTRVNILLTFEPEPSFCVPSVLVDGNPALFDPGLGFYWPIGDLVVSTPVGGSFSDTVIHSIHWENCAGILMRGFADENFNLVKDGGECKIAGSHDLTVPVEETTWGAIKGIYSE